MSESEKVQIVPAARLGLTETAEAKKYWSSLKLQDFYKKPETHWSRFMAEEILSFQPLSVLEFGCNVGRNLESLRQRAPDLKLQGIDINADAVEFGRRERHLDLVPADETFFEKQACNAFDVVFTVSVLDHLASPKPVLAEMVRVARLAVLLLEPTLGEDGKVIRNTHPSTGEAMESTPYTYSWDYKKLSAGLSIEFSEKPYPLSGTNLGPYYILFRLVKK